MATSKLQALWNHPAGPKTIHFWAPTFKWGISIANIADFQKPPETLSYPQQIGIDTLDKSPNINASYRFHCVAMSQSFYSIFCLLYLLLSVITGTGLIWSRYSTVITPKNWNLFSVSLGMAATGIYQLTRKIKHDYASEADPMLQKNDEE
ncbi:PREDICTED: mitochondrial pyruvate carrier 3-like isoform X1 [Camelina sativa]|uniref:Mitochondrial pyruvate carrier n=1 Tax=Camelina sativa TaxID=90675 RepID=A0ABM0TY72_CAMSA|nr:PREDICTED: mitochondrial pyruvate carrier 3-like isoform X1 [Camelina sativa]